MQALGALFFMIMSWYILDDKNAAERQIHSNQTIPEDEEGGEEEEGGGPIFRGAREDVLATEE